MIRRLALVTVWLLAVPLGTRADGPDDRYVRIYTAILEADSLNEKGQSRPAVTKYLEAEAALKNLQTSYPGWYEKVVTYRLGYIASKLAPLVEKFSPTNAPPALAAGTAASTNAVAPVVNEQIAAMQEQIARQTAQNLLLEAKLKEALSVQPAALNPQELAKAEERIKALQKENDLLKVSLEQEQARVAKMADIAAIEEERKLLAETKTMLAQQTELAASLQKENEGLKGQLAEFQRPLESLGGTNDAAQNLQLALAAIATLQASNQSLRAQQALLEAQFGELARPTGGASTRTARQLAAAQAAIKALEKDRDELRKKLQFAMKELEKRNSRFVASRVDDLARQLEAVRARLTVYETKPVPYTTEELALFKQPDGKVAIADPARAAKKKVVELPPGAGALMAEAQHAFEKRQFDAAEKIYRQVLQQDDKHVYTLGNLAVAQMEQNHLDEAEKTLRQALAIDPEDAACLFYLGRLKFMQEKYDDALDAFSLSAKVIPDEPRTQYFLGKTFIQKGNRGAAETALRKAVQLRPGWGEAHYSLALVYAAQQPPFKELAQWHYNKARDGGYPPDTEFERLLAGKKTEPTTP